MSPRIIAFRHAPVVDEGLCYGRHEARVARGADDVARQVASTIDRTVDVAAVWSSPAERCRLPAELVARSLGVPYRMDERLWELSFGEWEGREWKEIEENDPARLTAWMESWLTAAAPGGETVQQLTDRVRDWYRPLSANEFALKYYLTPSLALASAVRSNASRHSVAPRRARAGSVPWIDPRSARGEPTSCRAAISIAEGAGTHLLIGHAGVIRALRVITGRSDWSSAMAAPVEPLASEAFLLRRDSARP